MPGKLRSSIKPRQALGKHGPARSVCSGWGEGECWRGGELFLRPSQAPFPAVLSRGAFSHLSKRSRTGGQEPSLPGARSRVFPRFFLVCRRVACRSPLLCPLCREALRAGLGVFYRLPFKNHRSDSSERFQHATRRGRAAGVGARRPQPLPRPWSGGMLVYLLALLLERTRSVQAMGRRRGRVRRERLHHMGAPLTPLQMLHRVLRGAMVSA